MPNVTIRELTPRYTEKNPFISPIRMPNTKQRIIPSGTLPVIFIVSINGIDTNARRDPIEISTSPAINKTEKPIAAIRMIDIWPETFIIFLNVKKYSELKEKTTNTIKNITNNANSPFLRYLKILFILTD